MNSSPKLPAEAEVVLVPLVDLVGGKKKESWCMVGSIQYVRGWALIHDDDELVRKGGSMRSEGNSK